MYKEENRDLKMGLGQCTKNSKMEIKLICLFPIPIGGLGKRNKQKKNWLDQNSKPIESNGLLKLAQLDNTKDKHVSEIN